MSAKTETLGARNSEVTGAVLYSLTLIPSSAHCFSPGKKAGNSPGPRLSATLVHSRPHAARPVLRADVPGHDAVVPGGDRELPRAGRRDQGRRAGLDGESGGADDAQDGGHADDDELLYFSGVSETFFNN